MHRQTRQQNARHDRAKQGSVGLGGYTLTGLALTLNQRVAGSSPARLTIISNDLRQVLAPAVFVGDKLVTSFLPIL